MVKTIVSWGIVDILEISGGTYSNPGKSPSYPLVNNQLIPSLRFSRYHRYIEISFLAAIALCAFHHFTSPSLTSAAVGSRHTPHGWTT